MKAKIVLLSLLCTLLLLAPGFAQVPVSSMGWETAHETGVTLSQPFPNPASHSTKVKFELGTEHTAQIHVYNLLGTRMSSYPLHTASGELSIPVHELQSGIYFLRLEIKGKETLMRKLKVVR